MAKQVTAERWQRIKELFHAALEREARARPGFLDQACAGDDELRAEVESLLAEHHQPDSFIDKPAVEVAAELLATAEYAAAAGRTIGPYRVLDRIGRGGMGDVYLAQDTRLGRRVALKMLPARFTTDEDRLRRFKQEARAASALNHPNIITIHEVGHVDAAHFIATEFVEGRTLRAAFESGGMKLDEALDVAIQVASALRAAHEAGIIHRDIKPENIMLRPDGYVKVVDFGLAKLTEQKTMSDDPETSFRPVDTNPGMVMGTVSYMSPEQVRGLAVDARTDLFSLGVVLYEVVAGRAPFVGATVSDVIAAILEKEPLPLSSSRSEVPMAVEAIIDKALAKKKEDRYQAATEMLDDLRRLKQDLELQARIGSGSAEAFLAAVSPRASGEKAAAVALPASTAAHLTDKLKRRGKAAIIIAAAVALAAVVFLLNRLGEKGRAGQPSPAAPFQAIEITRITTVRNALAAIISPDGRYVAYVTSDVGRQTIWLKQLATNTDTILVPPAEFTYRWLAFSPDGNYLYYSGNAENEPRALYRMAATGGPARKVPLRFRSTNISFSADGKRMAFVDASTGGGGERALIVADVDGSNERKLASRKLPEWFSYSGAAWSPDEKVIVCGEGRRTDREVATPVAVSVTDGTVRPITSRQWSSIGKVAWLRDGSGLVMVAAEDAAGEIGQLWFLTYPGGEVRRITNDLSSYNPDTLSLTADSSALLSLKTDVLCNIWVAPTGAPSRAKQITFGPVGKGDGFSGLAWTPAGKLVYGSYLFKGQAIFIMNADGTDARQVTGGDYMDFDFATTLDGRYIVESSNRSGRRNIWRLDMDGNNPKQLTTGPADLFPHCSPDGKWVFYTSNFEGKWMLYKVPIDGGDPIRLFDRDSNYPAVSPDGKLVALVYWDEQVNTRRAGVISAETGQLLKAFDFGYYWNYLRWTPDGRAVAYIKTESEIANIWAQPLDGGKTVPLTDFKSELIFNFAWSNDGKQLAIARGTETHDVVLIRDAGQGAEK